MAQIGSRYFIAKMDIPEFRRGLELTSRELNRLGTAVRSAAITSVIGGTFSRTPGGTALVIDQQVRGGGAGTTCAYFAVTDASLNGSLKVEVAQNLIAGRWPDGMGLGYPPFVLDISGNSYIYAKVKYNTTTLQILEDSNAITILQNNAILPNLQDSVYILIATITVGGDPRMITNISNVCSQPQPNPCELAWQP